MHATKVFSISLLLCHSASRAAIIPVAGFSSLKETNHLEARNGAAMGLTERQQLDDANEIWTREIDAPGCPWKRDHDKAGIESTPRFAAHASSESNRLRERCGNPPSEATTQRDTQQDDGTLEKKDTDEPDAPWKD